MDLRRHRFLFAIIVLSSLFLLVFLFPAQSQPNTSLGFDGVNDQVNIANPGNVFDFTTGTVEAWVKPGSFNANKAKMCYPNEKISCYKKATAGVQKGNDVIRDVFKN